MKILVACEESQTVTIELRARGHEAYSCDIEPCSGGHPEWHIQEDGRENMNTPPKNYHLTKSEYRYKLDRQRADIAINEATHDIIDVIHERYHDQETLKMLLRLEEELVQLKEFYIVAVNEYMDMCNSTEGEEE